MSNTVERLFDSVLPVLKESAEQDAEEPVLKSAVDDDILDGGGDILDDPWDSDEDGVYSRDEVDAINQGHDTLADRRASQQLPPEQEEAVEGGIRSRGFDALAFYKSRRLVDKRPYQGRWGIFYLKHGLVFVEAHVARNYPGYGSPRALAWDFLREHERFHFRADLQTLMLEAVGGHKLYEPVRRAFRGRRNAFVEEALANRQVWDWSKKGAVGLEEFSLDFMKLQPGAYARFDEPRLDLAAEWAANVLDRTSSPSARRYDFSHWVEASPQGLMRRSLCPEYVVYPNVFNHWFSPALVLPPVVAIADGTEVIKRLSSRFANLRDRWEKTKEKLLENRLRHGLNFKPWPKDGRDCYSVKVDEGNRAHLRHEGTGQWTAYIVGPHKELGHG